MRLEAIPDRKKEGRDDFWFPGGGFLEQLVPCHQAQSALWRDLKAFNKCLPPWPQLVLSLKQSLASALFRLP